MMKPIFILNYLRPSRDPGSISRLASASVILAMIYRLVTGVCHFEPSMQAVPVRGDLQPHLVLDLLIFSGPYLLFAALAIVSVFIRRSPDDSKSRLIAVIGIAVNVALMLHQAYAVWRNYYGYL